MTLRLTSRSILSLALAGTLCACSSDDGDEATPDEVAARLRATVPGLIDPTARSVEFAGESTALSGLADSLFALTASAEEGEAREAREAPEMPDGDQAADDLVELIFNQDNYEGEGVYRIPPELLCPEDIDTGAVDAECLARAEQAELRVRVELVDDGLDLTLLVGPARAEPVVLELRPDRLTVIVDLHEAAEALTHLAAITGESISLPDVFEGQISFSLIVHGPEEVSFEVAVLSEIAIALDTDGGRFAFTTAPRTPLFGLRIDAAAREIIALLDLGPTTLSMPWQSADSASLASGTWSLDWKGLSFTALARDSDDAVAIGNIGLGDDTSTLSLDDTTLLAIDLNQDDDRRFAMTLKPDPAGGLPLIDFTPGVELVMDVFFQPLADAGDLVDSWLLDDTYLFALDGDPATTQSIPADLETGAPDALRVAAGTLTIASDTQEVVVPAGQCLREDPVTEGEHPLIGAMTAGDCP